MFLYTAGTSLLPPKNLVATSTSTSITLTWNQPHLDDSVHVYYVITYTYIVRECSILNSQVTVLVNDSSSRTHTIDNGPQTPIEEDSTYNITLFAVSDTGIESDTVSTMVQTSQAGTLQSISIILANL